MIFWNIFFNWIDIVYEVLTLYQAYEIREYTTVGTYIAKITSDIFFKSPVTISWNYKNSDMINEEWGEPLDLVNGIINEINQILIYFGEPPLDIEVQEPEQIIEHFDEFGEPIV